MSLTGEGSCWVHSEQACVHLGSGETPDQPTRVDPAGFVARTQAVLGS